MHLCIIYIYVVCVCVCVCVCNDIVHASFSIKHYILSILSDLLVFYIHTCQIDNFQITDNFQTDNFQLISIKLPLGYFH